MATNHWKTSNHMFDRYKKKNPGIEMSKTGYVELVRYPYKIRSKKERNLYLSMFRVPYYRDKESDQMILWFSIHKKSLAYKKARVLFKEEDVFDGPCPAFRVLSVLNSSEEDKENFYNTYYKYYAIPKKEIDKIDNTSIDKSNLS